MKLVLDTNVLIAAFVSRGTCHELLEYCQRDHDLITSEYIIGELERVLLEKFGVSASDVSAAIALLRASMTMVSPEPLSTSVSRDPDDDLVLATARAAGCDVLITGDRDLLILERFEEIPVLAPSDFWAYEAAHRPGS